MDKDEILVQFSGGMPGAVGNIWRITAKKTDFYLDPLGDADAVHLSVHGPRRKHPDGHRFHVKVDDHKAARAEQRGNLLVHHIGPSGYAFDGQELAPGVFRVARLRWLWDLQRLRYQRAAAYAGPVPEIADNRFGARLSMPLEPNDAADVDLVVSYGEPYWPHAKYSLRDNSRLGPLRNDAGMCLTATSFHRSQVRSPAPEGLVPPLPRRGQEPHRIMGGGPGQHGTADMYWFVEAITARELMDRAIQRWTDGRLEPEDKPDNLR